VGARALVTLGALLTGCAGPDPRIERVEIVAPRLPGHVRVHVAVVNRSSGHGQVQIELRLTSRSSPRTLAAGRPLELDGHERVELAIDVSAPDGGDYAAEAHVRYPD
jgi:hypothetical protein